MQKETYALRRERLRQIVRARGLDAFLVAKPANRFYLSGFELHDPQPDESCGYLVICADGQDWLATDSRYELAVQKIWQTDRVFIYNRAGATLNKLLASLGSIIGVETDSLSALFWQRLRKGKNFVPAYVPANGLVESLRIRKDEAEITAMRKSFALNHRMMDELDGMVKSGKMATLTEKRLAWQIELFFRENGAQELAFESIVAAGDNAALPHAVPTDRPIGQGADLLVDIGCRVDNYCSDQTRTWWIGQPVSPEFEKTLRLVRDAQKAAMDIMRPGVKCSAVYKKALEVFEKAGVAKAFTHGLGHGVGLQTHEAPSLSARCATQLEEGMTVTVEPGLYYGDWGGARWEHTVLITSDGIEVF